MLSAVINGPCGFWEQRSSSKREQSNSSNVLRSNDIHVDLLLFEVFADNDELCGQAAIPLAYLRTGMSMTPCPLKRQ